jgi:hypothetical protein
VEWLKVKALSSSPALQKNKKEEKEKEKRACGMAPLAEHIPSKCKIWSLNLSAAKKEQKHQLLTWAHKVTKTRRKT